MLSKATPLLLASSLISDPVVRTTEYVVTSHKWVNVIGLKEWFWVV